MQHPDHPADVLAVMRAADIGRPHGCEHPGTALERDEVALRWKCTMCGLTVTDEYVRHMLAADR